MSTRKKINHILKNFGYVINRFDLFAEFLNAKYESSPNFTFIQVGANDGVNFDYLYDFVTSRKSTGVVIEPLDYYFGTLAKNYEKFPDITPLKCALHATEKEASMHYVDPAKLHLLPKWSQGIGSLDSEHHKKTDTPSEHIISEKVECRNLMSIIEEYQFDELTLLQIDAEGYDHEVIKMINFDEIQPSLIKYEHKNIAPGDNREISRLLKSQGYSVFKQGSDTIAHQD